jgi:arginyl-tRNA synthetase
LLRDLLASLVETCVDSLIASGELPEGVREVPVEIIDTRQPEHGDYACNFAMMATKKAGKNPRQIAQALAEPLRDEPAFAAVEVAGPGFLNFRLEPEFVAAYVPQILARGVELARTTKSNPKKLNVEFVSVNPNGPITVGSGRGAAFGDVLSRVLAATGEDVTKEYYINDGVNSEQMRLFAESVRSYVVGAELPEKGYKGEYVQAVAQQIGHLQNAADEGSAWFQQKSQDLMIERQRGDLAKFGTEFDVWFSEQSMHDSGEVKTAVDKLIAQDTAYWSEKPLDGSVELDEEAETPDQGKALWLKSSQMGDDKDRVVMRSDGRPAYIAADIAYLENKLGIRGFDKSLLIVGPDHHGYIPRLYAAYQALGYPMKDGKPDRFEMIIFQIVRFLKDGKPAPMRKRDGNIYELRDLIDELGKAAAPEESKEEQTRIGRDVARFFYLMRSHDTHMDFDIDLATKQSDENPVFYVQYAHARIASVIAKAAENGLVAGEREDVSRLIHPRETALIKKVLDLPSEVERCAEDYGVHRLTTFATELARSFHHFYDACRVVQVDEPELSRARLQLCQAAKLGLRSTLDLLGISAPEFMQRTSS